MADARPTANHMLIDDIDHECTKVVCNMSETARASVFRDWAVTSPIRVNNDRMSRFVGDDGDGSYVSPRWPGPRWDLDGK